LIITTIWGGYRVQIGIYGVYLMFFLSTRIELVLSRIKFFSFLLVVGLFIFLMSLLIDIDNLFYANFSRFSELSNESESGRAMELKYAWNNFLESPLFGKGIGYQVPTEITTSGLDELLAREFPKTVGYLHNVVGYFLINIGFIGTVFYLIFFFYHLISSLSVLPIWLLMTFLFIFLFVLVEATFRLIHFNLILLTFHYIFWKIKEEYLKFNIHSSNGLGASPLLNLMHNE
jgi:hypothetical protein